MTVDSKGGLWVTDVAGHLFQADANTGACAPTAYQPSQSGFTRMGMAFVGHPDGTETLFVVDDSNGPLSTDGLGLGTIDLVALQLASVGNFPAPLTGHVAELAGTSDGHLYGFFLGPQSFVAEIDPARATLLWSTPVTVPLVPTGPAHVVVATALWQGLLYVFLTNSAVAPSADVYAFDLTSRATTTVQSQVGFNVTGAAVRSCTLAPPTGG
jgi:hypothetical protein